MGKMTDKIKEMWLYYKNEFKKSFEDLRHKDTFYKQIPNLLTISRVIGMIPVMILFITGNSLFAMVLLGLVLTTDFFDGKIARKYGLVSKFGADLDAVSDKLMALLLMFPLCFINPILIFNIVMEFLISFINVKGRINNVDTRTIGSGKVKTCFLSVTLFLGYLSKFLSGCRTIFVLLSLLTAIMQIKTCHDYSKVISVKENECIIDDDNSLEEEKVRKEDRIDELKRERERLISLRENKEINKTKVRKRKK